MAENWSLIDEIADQLAEARSALKTAEDLAELAELSRGERAELTQMYLTLDQFIEQTGLYTPRLGTAGLAGANAAIAS